VHESTPPAVLQSLKEHLLQFSSAILYTKVKATHTQHNSATTILHVCNSLLSSSSSSSSAVCCLLVALQESRPTLPPGLTLPAGQGRQVPSDENMLRVSR
jgi:hypothetical protein